MAMIFRAITGAIDRGACIKELSQYPAEVSGLLEARLEFILNVSHLHRIYTCCVAFTPDLHMLQVEYLWVPCSFIEPAGVHALEVVEEQDKPAAMVSVVPVGCLALLI
jgi:hypothetical protein